MSKSIQAGHDVVVKVVLPKPKSDEKVAAAFFRKSRRKTFDLSILNAAFVARIAGDAISSVDVVFGGSDHALTNAATDGPAVAKNTIKALTGKLVNAALQIAGFPSCFRVRLTDGAARKVFQP